MKKLLTDSVNFVHENDTRLMIPSVVEHLADKPGTFANVFVDNSTWYDLEEGKLVINSTV